MQEDHKKNRAQLGQPPHEGVSKIKVRGNYKGNNPDLKGNLYYLSWCKGYTLSDLDQKITGKRDYEKKEC